MCTLFLSQELWELVEHGYSASEADEQKLRENKKKDARALFFLQQAVSNDIFSRISAATTSKGAWQTLKTEFQGSSKVITVKLQSLRRTFEMLQMGNSETVQVFLSRASAIVSQMKAYGEKITDETVVLKLLRSLTPKFDHLVAAIEESKDFTTYSFDDLMGSLQAHEDSGSSNHMTGSKQLFKELDEKETSTVRLGDDKVIQVEGKGTIAINTSHGNTKFLKDVQFVPGLAYNLLSVGQLMANGYRILFDDNSYRVEDRKTGHTFINVQMAHNMMFPLDVSNVNTALAVSKTCESKLWHLRYGHLHENGLKLLSQKNMVNGLPKIKSFEFCEGCVLGEHRRLVDTAAGVVRRSETPSIAFYSAFWSLENAVQAIDAVNIAHKRRL
ncbi:Retrovirus-related Pol polyprotein from transposon TNT 1-94 [Senna tora]|uniref:Retrovirus-related Pol polyprotein from transposon TNT 1-94 n=1 Tax=Senna tora TaxID=362788 RepID=A0A834WUK7_9FABA|nr:Retrovirus-related Pol polyprotein from transposon TNT 1-94 [Senna tora]